MKREPVRHRPVDIGEPMQVEERRPVSAFQQKDRFPLDLEGALPAHRGASSPSSSGNSLAKSSAESRLSWGMTWVAKSRWLRRVR